MLGFSGIDSKILHGWRPVVVTAVRPLFVVASPPLLDDDLGFGNTVEQLSVQTFSPEGGIEALVAAVLPGLSWLDQRGASGVFAGRLGAHEPTSPHRYRFECSAVDRDERAGG